MTYYTFNGGGGHAPKGGVIVADIIAGVEKEYKGGQFLPQTTPPLNPKQKKAIKTALSRLSEIKGESVKKRDIIAVTHHSSGEKQLCFLVKDKNGYQGNYILSFRFKSDFDMAISSFENLVIDNDSYREKLIGY